MLRRLAVAVVAALSLVAAPGVAPGSQAVSARPDPLDGLAYHPEWGSVTGKPGVLRGGCHSYTYRYTVNPPEGVWALEVFISGPGFKHLAAGGFLDGYDPRTGTGHYKLCKPVTRYGRFKIEAKVSVDDGAGHIVEGRTAKDTYRLHPPRH